MTKPEKIAQHKRLHNRFSKQFRPVVHTALKSQYDFYTSSLKSHGVQYVLSHGQAHLIDPLVTAAITRIYVVAGIARATLTYRELQRLPKVEKKSGAMGFNAQWTNDIIAYFRQNLFNKVVLPISETTKEYIESVLKKGIAEGWSIDRMVLEIERKDYLDGRVERILRTEINRAINFGEKMGADAFPFKTKKEWISVHDDRTRSAHIEADGQVVEVDGYFSVGGEKLDFPGDPQASAENTVNCRCTTSITAVRNNRGGLIPDDSATHPPITGEQRTRIQEAIDALLS